MMKTCSSGVCGLFNDYEFLPVREWERVAKVASGIATDVPMQFDSEDSDYIPGNEEEHIRMLAERVVTDFLDAEDGSAYIQEREDALEALKWLRTRRGSRLQTHLKT